MYTMKKWDGYRWKHIPRVCVLKKKHSTSLLSIVLTQIQKQFNWKLVFSDWDTDLDDNDFADLKKHSPLSHSFKLEDIHKVLGAGFHEECLVSLQDGRDSQYCGCQSE